MKRVYRILLAAMIAATLGLAAAGCAQHRLPTRSAMSAATLGVAAAQAEESIAGSVMLPVKAVIFGPFAREDGVPAPELLRLVPAALKIGDKQVAGRTADFSANRTLDLAPFTGAPMGNTAWVYLPFKTETSGPATFGFGADWWYEAYLDGTLISETLSSSKGNITQPPGIHDFTATVEMAKGDHVLAIRMVRSTSSAMLAVGGPQDLRNAAKKTFIAEQDPGLKLVWSDEFNGTTIDEKKWIRMPGGSSPIEENKSTGIKFRRDIDSIALDGKGNLKFKMSRDENGVYVGSVDADFYSRKKFLYGYFEARVQFCREPGFWSSFWLMNIPHAKGGNPFIYGLEIDVYEDFFKTNKPKSEAEDSIAQSLVDWSKGRIWQHVAKVKNWSDFHTVGVEWTPLEIIWYVDGIETYRLDSKKQPVSIVPMPVVTGLGWRGGVSTQPGVEFPFYGDIRFANLPDYLTVDYVRVYQRPAAYKNVPTIRVRGNMVAGKEKKEGDQIKITADLPAGDLGGTVYLFDSGYLIQETTQRNGVFSITFNQETYPASGPVPLLGTHAFAVLTKDAKGLMEHSKAIVVEVATKEVSKPYKGTPQSIPGRVQLPFYDEGGKGVAYHDADQTNAVAIKGFRADEGVDTEGTMIGWVYDGEWLKYTVDVKETGTYTIAAAMGTPAQYFLSQGIQLSIDGKLVGKWRLDKPTASFGDMARITKKGIRLKKGLRVLKLTALGSTFSARDLEFLRE